MDPNDPSGETLITVNNFENDERTEGDDSLSAQWTFSVELGAAF